MPDRPMHTVPGLFDRLTALYADGMRASVEGRLHDAIALFSEAIQLDDQFRQGNVTLYAQRAFAYQRLGDNMGAIRDYGRAIEIDPQYGVAYANRGRAYRQAVFAQLTPAQQATFDRETARQREQ